MKKYKDYTMDNAVAAVDKEWRMMAGLAVIIRTSNTAKSREMSSRFKGIYKRLLEDPIDEVKLQAKGGMPVA